MRSLRKDGYTHAHVVEIDQPFAMFCQQVRTSNEQRRPSIDLNNI